MSSAQETLPYLPGLASLSPAPNRIFPSSWRGRYPHLMPLDIAIWTRALERFGKEFLGFQYDVLVGDGAEAPVNFSPSDKALLLALTVKRIDVVGIRSDKLLLIEVKPRLGMAAVGQLVAYNLLWRRQYGDFPRVEMAWIGEQAEADLQYVMDRLGFRSVLV